MADKIFCGNVKLKEASYQGQSWKYFNLSFTRDDLKKMDGFFSKEGFCNLNINKSRSGNYYVEIDTYGLPKPGDAPQEEAPASQEQSNDAPEPPVMEDEFPDLEDAFNN